MKKARPIEKKPTNGEKDLIKPAGKGMLYIIGIMICIVTAIAYSPTYTAEMVRFDDHQYVVRNEGIRSLAPENIASFFYKPVGDTNLYAPLVYLSFAVEYSVTELDPHQYHVDNVMLHCANSMLVLWLVWLLCNNVLVSAIVAGLFALHPLHVESVAWVTERKDLLYSLFFLLSLISYHLFSKEGKSKYYAFALLFFVLSCLSKPMAITLPAIVLLYDLYYKKQRSWSILKDKIPFFAVATATSFAAIKLMNISYDHQFLAGYNVFDRVMLFFHGIGFYIIKTILPLQLSALYTYPVKTGALLPLYYIFSALLTMAACWLALSSKYTNDIIRACFLFFLISLLPVLQILPNTSTITADRYAYMPTLGLYGILLYCARVLTKNKKLTEGALRAGGIVILVFLSVLTNGRARVWTDTRTLFSDVLEKGQYRSFVFADLGQAYAEAGESQKAFETFKRGNSEYPDNVALKTMYAGALGNAKLFDEAITQYLEIMKMDSSLVGVYINLGDAYLRTGKKEEAIKILHKGYDLHPTDDMCLYNLAYAYWTMDNREQAAQYFRIAAKRGFQPAIGFMGRHEIQMQ